MFGFEVTLPVLLLGAITGITYGALAVGLVLIYRSSRIINFSHGEIGAFGASLLGLAVVQWGVPYWVAFLLAMGTSAAVGALAEIAVVRRLRDAPKVMSLVATLGLAQFLLLLSLALNSQAEASLIYPQPPGLPQFQVGPLRVTSSYFAMLFVVPLLVAGLAAFLRHSHLGIEIQAASGNPESARLSGVFARRMSTLVWAIGGAIAAVTVILIRPTQGFVSAEVLGPRMLLRALAAAVLARMDNLPLALVAGLGIGIVEQQLLWNFRQSGLVEVVIFGIILLALLTQSRQAGREEEKGNWIAVRAWPPLADAFTRSWALRNLGRMSAAASVGVALLLSVVITNTAAVVLTVILSFALVGLSVGIVTGLAGQLSLGQFALAGVGATVSFYLARHTGNYVLAFGAAGAAAAGASLLVGLPALRIRGLMLAVATLGFALASNSWLFQQSWMMGEGREPGRPIIGGLALDTSKRYYLFAIGVLVVAVWMTRNVWRSGVGRRLRAIRDNEDAARAFTVSSTVTKLQAFILAGFLAGLGGALYGHGLSRISTTAFPIMASINLVAMTVLGGIGVLVGPLIGALYIVGLPEFLPLDNAGLAATSLGWLLLILYFPGGIAQVVRPLRDRLAARLARGARQSDAVHDEHGGVAATGLISGLVALDPGARARDSTASDGQIVLEAENLGKSYGGIRAVDAVSFQVSPEETVGLIGPNGAGKTTLFELLSGFTTPDTGTVLFQGEDLGRLSPEERGRRGLIRSFQDATLFETLTVVESVEFALERVLPTRFLPAVAGFRRTERMREQRARDIVHLMGLDPYRSKQIGDLSTGTRRITEFACMLALEPVLLLLDEPSSGIAQRETEALAEILVDVKRYLGVTLLIIEHDMPLVMGLSDRVIAMESGRVLSTGSPEAVRRDPLVIQSYLGGDSRAIERSGVATLTAHPLQCRQTTKAGTRCSRQAVVGDDVCVQHQRMEVRR